MKNQHIEKVNKEINEVIIPIMRNWTNYSELELEQLLTKLGTICRDESSLFRQKELSDKRLSDVLLEIGEKYKDNNKMLIQIISSIHNMYERYSLEISDEIFHFLLTHTENKKINFYISIFITELPQFKLYKNKWKYIISIPNISPKNKSVNTFYRVVNNNVNDIPTNYKSHIIEFFNTIIANNDLHASTVLKYQRLINEMIDSRTQ